MRKLLLSLGLVAVLLLLQVSTAAAAPPKSGGYWHTVRYGETLSTIGWRYGVNPYHICSANGLYNCNYIRAGQRLWIPDSSPVYHRPTYHPDYRPDYHPDYRPTYHSYYRPYHQPYRVHHPYW